MGTGQFGRGPLQSPAAERFESFEAAELGERFLALVQVQEAGLLERLALLLPNGLGFQPSFADKGQTEDVFGFKTGQAGGRVEHAAQIVTLGQFARFGGHRLGDFGKLAAVWKRMLDDRDQRFQLGWNLDNRRENDGKGPLLLA